MGMFGWARVPHRVGNAGVSPLRALRFGRDDARCRGAKAGLSPAALPSIDMTRLWEVLRFARGKALVEGQDIVSLLRLIV